MKHKEMRNLIEKKILPQITQTRDSGQKEYAHDEDNVFANFERVGKSCNISREQALWVYASKHFDGISAYIKGYKSQREDVRGRLTDLTVYLWLLWGMIEESESKS